MRTGLLLAIPALSLASAATAQSPANDAPGALRRSFNEVAGYVTRSAEMVPPEKYSYRPTESVRTFAQQIAHIADAHNYYCAHANGRNIEWSDAAEKGSLDKATVIQKLRASIEACSAAYASGQVGPLVSNVGHTNLHYGNIITYLRMMGMVPPSS
jgi:uncharacterized damage-inducible protein DinB